MLRETGLFVVVEFDLGHRVAPVTAGEKAGADPHYNDGSPTGLFTE